MAERQLMDGEIVVFHSAPDSVLTLGIFIGHYSLFNDAIKTVYEVLDGDIIMADRLPMDVKLGAVGQFITLNDSLAREYKRITHISQDPKDTRSHNVGKSDYSKHKIQPWDIWLEYGLNPWDADIVKRVLRNKEGDTRKMEYEKIIHICQERIRQLELGLK